MKQKIVVDVENILQMKGELNQLNKFDLEDCEFWYDGQKVKLSKHLMDEWHFTGLIITDFIMSYDWPENPAFMFNREG